MRACSLRLFSSSLSSRRLTSFFISIRETQREVQTIQLGVALRTVISNPDIPVANLLHIVNRGQHTQSISDASSNIDSLIVTLASLIILPEKQVWGEQS